MMTEEQITDLYEEAARELVAGTDISFNGTNAALPPVENESEDYSYYKNNWQFLRIGWFQMPSKVFPGLYVKASISFDIRKEHSPGLIIATIKSAIMSIEECEEQGRETGKPVNMATADVA